MRVNKEEIRSRELEKTYDPKKIERKLYDRWCENKYFHAEVDRSRKPFTTVMPPPNITGKLHMGHALDNTLQDILIRYKRMEGYNELWIPGTDHAAISTEVKVTNQLKEEGIDKKELGREGFLKRTWQWKEEYAGTIENQLKQLGISCDWDRERFTMDEGCSKAVEEVFINLYKKGYIYKGSRIINWCPKCKTSLSDAEVEHEEQEGHFWHIKYPIVGTDRFLEIATTRPETMLGDTAIAVHPDDERYQDIIGKNVILPLVGREIPIVADYYVDKEFGTGAVKITPAHDPNDFEVGKRHNLEEINIMNDDATINEKGGKYAGMDRYEARKAIVKDLEEQGYLVKVVPHVHAVGTHDRCGTTVEPLIKQQWFVKNWRSRRSLRWKKASLSSFRSGLTRSTCTGWRISKTGASHARSGGDTGSRHTTATSAARSLSPKECRRSARTADALISRRMRIRWTPGSHLHCGRSPHLDGRSTRRIMTTSIRRTCS